MTTFQLFILFSKKCPKYFPICSPVPALKMMPHCWKVEIESLFSPVSSVAIRALYCWKCQSRCVESVSPWQGNIEKYYQLLSPHTIIMIKYYLALYTNKKIFTTKLLSTNLKRSSFQKILSNRNINKFFYQKILPAFEFFPERIEGYMLCGSLSLICYILHILSARIAIFMILFMYFNKKCSDLKY